MIPTAESQQPCARCGHQQGCHTGGAQPGGWAIYEPTWANATGWCSIKSCDCPERVPQKRETTVGLEEQLAEQLKAAITNDVVNKPRSLQKALGPSEIGEPCQRKLAYKLLDWLDVKPNQDADPLPSFVGTAAHEAMAAALERMNTNSNVWIVEKRVHASDNLSGNCDAYHESTDTATDHKFVGPASMKKYKADGPSELYRIQVQLYGLGWERAGYTPKNVAIAFYPRGGNLQDLHIWTAPYDRQVALDALTRLDTIRSAVIALDPEANPDRWGHFPIAASHACTYCPWYKPGSTDLSQGCPSEPNAVQPRKQPEELIA